ncbi:MAG: YceD family protein [Pseudomonadota bacterium]
MPQDGSKLCDVAVQADDERQVELAVPLAKLARLAPLLVNNEGMATGRIAFSRVQGRIIADVMVEARPQVRCQRCLGIMSLPISSQSRVALLAAESEVDAVPPELEVALAPEGRMRLADLVEEELLLAMPGAPRHAQGQCPDESGAAQEESVEPALRPLADLGRMMKPD